MKKFLSVAVIIVLFFAVLFVTVTLGMSTDDFIILVKEDGLYLEYFGIIKNREVQLAQGNSFERPEISPSGKFTAVVENGTLSIYQIEERELVYRYDRSSNYFNWDVKKDILYTSCHDGNLVSLDFDKKTIVPRTLVGDRNAIYSNIIPSESILFYNKSVLENGQNTPDGIWSFDMRTNQEKKLITANEEIYPVLSGISKDREYLYLFQYALQKGQNTDGVELAVFDLKNQSVMQYERPLVTLPYNQNLALNSEENLIVINSGENRHMNFHKTVGVFMVEDGSFTPLIPGDLVSMTPDICRENVIFSAGVAREHSTEANARLQIYQTNIKKQALQKLTEHDSSTQLNPVYLSKGKKIAYIRAYDDGWELWVMDNKGKRQRLVARDIKKLDNFYGSYYFYEIMDVYR